MIDILFCILPKIEPTAPLPGVGVLKSIATSHGYSSEILDLNISMWHQLDARESGLAKHFYYDNDEVWFDDFVNPNPKHKEFAEDYLDIFYNMITQILDKDPRIVGFSLLSQFSRGTALTLSKILRKKRPDIKIVWGGPTCDFPTRDFILKNNIADNVIIGDGEEVLVDILAGNELSAKQKDKNQLTSMDNLPFPDYSDINWEAYQGNKEVYITGSRGCVKSCTFCNVRDIWPKFVSRNGQQIVDEIIYLHKTYGRQMFRFTDSLINGNMKVYRDFVTTLCESEIVNNIKWSSQWIVRNKKTTLEADFQMAKLSNCNDLEIGIEHFSQEPRWHMGKKFTDEDMWHTFDLIKQYGIPSSILMIIGYPTETEEDHQTQLKTLRKLFKEGYTINKRTGTQIMHFSATPMILDGQIYQMVKDELTDYHDSINWTLGDNTTKVRQRRYQEWTDLLSELSGHDKEWMSEKNLRQFDA